jgi:hypothetical protein
MNRQLLLQKQEQLLNETVNWYSEDTSRRAEDGGECSYETEDGRHCAIGRLLNKSNIKVLRKNFGLGSMFCEIALDIKKWAKNNESLGLCLGQNTEDLSRHLYFGSILQELHDTGSNWNLEEGKGMTSKGRHAVSRIRRDIRDGKWAKIS